MAVQTTVTVLATLHHWHEHATFYTFEDLAQIIRQISPDLLGVELTPTDLETRKEQRIKQEYPRSVFPLLDEGLCDAFPLEPSEPLFSQLVQMAKQAAEALHRRAPEVEEMFGVYVESLYETLFAWWRSPFDVNSDETDRHFKIKHQFQAAVYGPEEREGWDAWNQHFLDQILEAANRRPGTRVLVLVGVEHTYWLRERLREEPHIHLVSVEEALGIAG